jgi:hypothetical protein
MTNSVVWFGRSLIWWRLPRLAAPRQFSHPGFASREMWQESRVAQWPGPGVSREIGFTRKRSGGDIPIGLPIEG